MSSKVDAMISELGKRASEARAALGLRLEPMSQLIGVPLATLKRTEAGRSDPSTRTICAYATAGTNLHWLLTGTDAPSAANKAAPEGVNGAALEVAIKAANAALQAARLDMEPAQWAKLIVQTYKEIEAGAAGPALAAKLAAWCDLIGDYAPKRTEPALVPPADKEMLSDEERHAVDVMRRTNADGRRGITAAINVAEAFANNIPLRFGDQV